MQFILCTQANSHWDFLIIRMACVYRTPPDFYKTGVGTTVINLSVLQGELLEPYGVLKVK